MCWARWSRTSAKCAALSTFGITRPSRRCATLWLGNKSISAQVLAARPTRPTKPTRGTPHREIMCKSASRCSLSTALIRTSRSARPNCTSSFSSTLRTRSRAAFS